MDEISRPFITEEEVDVLKPERQEKNGIAEMEDRRKIQSKLFPLNNKLLYRCKQAGMELYNHPKSKRNPSLITSSLTANMYNNGKVSWIGIRYGKSEECLKLLNYGADKNDKLAYQKFACMQVSVGYRTINIGIYHAVSHDAVDRIYLHENIDRLKDRIIECLDKLKFCGYIWCTWNPITNETSYFDLAKNNVEDFIDWYKKYDVDGVHLSFLKTYSIEDEAVNSDNIEDTCFNALSELYDLYKLLSWQPNEIKEDC